MPIGFVPCNDNEAERPELSEARESWIAWQVAEAWEHNARVRAAHQALFEQARRFAVQLELIDPSNRSAQLEMAKVEYALSGAQDARDRLGVLAQEARQLMLAVAEAKRQRLVRTRLLAALRRLAPVAEVAVFSLLLASVVLFILLTVDRGL
jgi:hypothetical protein